MNTAEISPEISGHALLQWVQHCNRRELADFVPFKIAGRSYGAIHREHLALFRAHDDVFTVTAQAVSLAETLQTPAQRSAALQKVTYAWYQAGVLSNWHNEPHRVTEDFHAPPVCFLERTAASLFGVQRYGVHMNGLCWKEGTLHMWISRRAAHNRTFPHHLDQLVAGGVAAGYTPSETLHKECAEEAAIPLHLAQTAKAAGIISYAMTENQRLIRDVLFVYDLYLPAEFVPQAADGEVACFYCWPLARVAEHVATTREFKPNTNLVIIDFLIRHGILTADMPAYQALCMGLRQAVYL